MLTTLAEEPILPDSWVESHQYVGNNHVFEHTALIGMVAFNGKDNVSPKRELTHISLKHKKEQKPQARALKRMLEGSDQFTHSRTCFQRLLHSFRLYPVRTHL